MCQSGYCLVAIVVLALASLTACFDVSIFWDVPDNAQDITQASTLIQLNSSTSPIGTEWIGIGWQYGALSLQKLNQEELVVIMQVRSPIVNSTVRVGRVTDFATAHHIDRKEGDSGMYLQSKISKDDANKPEYSLKILAHYNMVANNTIYQGLWSDGQIWTYMGSLIVQHSNTKTIKDDVARALEDAAHSKTIDWLKENSPTRNIVIGNNNMQHSRASEEKLESSIPIDDYLSRDTPQETLAKCNIIRNLSGDIRPVCKLNQQLSMVASFPQPFSAVRRTSTGNQKFKRAGIFRNLALKSRLGQVYNISNVHCISHNRNSTDIALCQRDPNNPEFIVSMDGLSSAKTRRRWIPGKKVNVE
ncbi:hypothetical protein COEREDRAFT_88774 [Coemansia reversa NRRL 1564]|uniref:Uncharacterized protein n=1 Tax=Coemansia reversa (strain ATCC 12441 / NRRL 1564) TaxID=763665 RepID=A0A2G5B5U6_COERN|nr:hypothetical protein COEREDRAFT_88774 [Coemansia reversa NRRL 1564]|eukprot:PIA14385.1 hypothetical protein COEREDRAFT_88774 [Coemansia reversa NRRL 1564]